MTALFLLFSFLNAAADTARLVSTNQVSHRGYPPAGVVAKVFLYAVPFVWAVAVAAAVVQGGWEWSSSATAGVVVSGVLNTAMVPLLAWAARFGGMGRASSWTGLSPVLVAFAAPLAGDSFPSPAAWAGVAALVAGLVLCNWESTRLDHPWLVSSAAAAATVCGASAALVERATVQGSSPLLFVAFTTTFVAFGLAVVNRALPAAQHDAEMPPLTVGVVAVPVAATVGVLTVGIGAIALGPAWVVLTVKRLAVPAATLLSHHFDVRAGRDREPRRVLIGSALVVAGVGCVAAFGR